MDPLDNLPETSVNHTPAEKQIMNKYFPAATETPAKSWFSSLKIVLFASLLFFLLSLGFVSSILSSLPFVSNSDLHILVTKTILFLFIFFVTERYFIST